MKYYLLGTAILFSGFVAVGTKLEAQTSSQVIELPSTLDEAAAEIREMIRAENELKRQEKTKKSVAAVPSPKSAADQEFDRERAERIKALNEATEEILRFQAEEQSRSSVKNVGATNPDPKGPAKNATANSSSAAGNSSDWVIAPNSPIARECKNLVGSGDFSTFQELFVKNFDRKEFIALYGETKPPRSEFSSSAESSDGRYQGPADLIKLCPNYGDFSEQQKDNLWWKAIGIPWMYFESTCKSKAVNHEATDGVGVGYFQLLDGRESERSGGCNNGDGRHPTRQFHCALSMLSDQVKRGENLFSSLSYWQVLRPQVTTKADGFQQAYVPYIMSRICNFKDCGQTGKQCERLIEKFKAEARAEISKPTMAQRRAAAQKNSTENIPGGRSNATTSKTSSKRVAGKN